MTAERAVPGFPIVVAAPSGTGKTTVCRALVAADPDLVLSVSHTTRPPRPTETPGVDYHFVSEDEFRRGVEKRAFLEWAEYNGHHYGTSLAAIEVPLSEGRDVLLEIEVQGARQVRERRPDARFIFLLPPSMQEVEGRLRRRATDSDAEIARRLEVARSELAAVRDFDYAVVNDSLERCIASVLEIVRAERSGDPAAVRARFDPGRAADRLDARSEAG